MLKSAFYIFLALAIAAAGAGGYLFLTHSSTSNAPVLVMAPQDYQETVTVSGTVEPAQDVALGFAQGGRISSVSVTVGDQVAAGKVLAQVENGDLRAAVAEQLAKLKSLQTGATSADIAVSQAALETANQDLDNLYAGIADIERSAYLSADDAVRTQLSTLFSGAETSLPDLAFATADSQAGVDAKNARVTAGVALGAWQKAIDALPSSPSDADLTTLLSESLGYLATIRDLITKTSTALDSSNLSGTAFAADKALVVAAQSEANAALKSINGASQAIDAQKAVVAQAKAALTLKKTGATTNDIAAQQAAVDQARALLAKTIITAPFSGVITKVDAKVGLAAAPSVPEISMESTSTLQIESYVPETSIAAVAVGQEASVTLDAYGPDVSFPAKIVSIDPAETVRDGVSTYRIVLQFDQIDPRVRSGMTATIPITTKSHPDALVVPSGAVFVRNGQSYVQVEGADGISDVPVELGSSSSVGTAYVASGLSAGQKVVLTPDPNR